MTGKVVDSLMARFRLDDCTAVLTGGYGEIGTALAETVAELGSSVVLVARRAERCEPLAAHLRERFGVQVAVSSADVSVADDVTSLRDQVMDQFGAVDVLINSAATFWAGAAEDVPIEKGWRRVVDVNLTGSFLMCQAFGADMLTRGRGSIINMSSSGGLKSFLPDVGSTISYTTTKGAIVNLTRDLAAQWAGRGVRVNALAPGSMAGGMTGTIVSDRQQRLVDGIPMGRQGRADELKGAVAFLASEASSYVTGSVVVVDGGQTIV